MTTKEFNDCVNNYVKSGGNEGAGRQLLKEILRTVGADSLDAALVYQGFKRIHRSTI